MAKRVFKELYKVSDQVQENVVDRKIKRANDLLQRAKQLQDQCKHSRKYMTEEVELRESLVSDVYIVGDATAHQLPWETRFILKCEDCSLEQEVFANSQCVRCLGDIKYIGLLEVKNREKYFFPAKDLAINMNYIAQEGVCKQCGLKLVWDEWRWGSPD